MKTFGRVEIEDLLRRLDDALIEPADLIVIGGAAAVLAYGATRPTTDIDTWGNVPASVSQAHQRIATGVGPGIALGRAAVADLPYDAEDRFVPVALGLQHLRVWVPERYDLVLSKVVRGYQHDYETIQQIHAINPLDMKTLLERFEQEMGAAIADPAKLRLNVAILVERLYGQEEGRTVAERWGVPVPHTRR
jgi:hypothetical protein